MSFSIVHLGAENDVTGSCHLLQTAGLNIMIDCGSCQGKAKELSISDWPLTPGEIDYLFITHAHIDHIGRLPEIIEHGFAGEVICTHATKLLIRPMLIDAMRFSVRSETEIEQLAKQIDELSWGFEYGEEFSLKKGISFRLKNAGHILGSCFIRITSKSAKWSIIFSGDIGAENTPILPDPDSPEPCDLLILEATYGDRCHEDRKERIRRFGKILTHALSDNGKVFIPAFALGRTQELIYEMDRLFSDELFQKEFPELNRKNKVPVFIDSPLGVDITNIYANLAPFWDQNAQKILRTGNHPIDFAHLYAVKNHKHHRELLTIPGPLIIIAGSGMCTGGRIVSHIQEGLKRPENDIFFVGYQGDGTLGREIIKYSRLKDGYVTINGERVSIKAQIHKLSGYSAHADQKGLARWLERMPEKPGNVKLVHAERPVKSRFKRHLTKKGYCVSI